MDPDLIVLMTMIDDWLALTAVRDRWENDDVRDRLLELRNAVPREVTA